MKKNNILIVIVVFVGLLVLYAVFNQIDSTQKIFSEKDFHPATFETHNAFYLIWALAEPPGTDILSNEVIARYRVP
ncbi:MAG: hypothetical protein GY757_08105, partial [bacterium]|nr:hypothetical protein [bacterium]